jgi:Phage integrase family
VVLFGRQHVRDGVLTFTQQKNRARRPVRLFIPLHPELQAILDATPSAGLTFLTSEHGEPFASPDSFGNAFRRWCREAALPHCSAHGLRKAAASRLAERGATPHEIMAVTGHRTLKEVERYTREASRGVMAASAMARMSAAITQQEKSHPSPGRPEWDENTVKGTDNADTRKRVVPRGGIEPPTLRFSVHGVTTAMVRHREAIGRQRPITH